MVRTFSIKTQTSTGITFSVPGVSNKDLRFFVIYDTSTGEVLPDYIIWKTLSDSNFDVSINDSILFPRHVLSYDYRGLFWDNFVMITSFEEKVLEYLVQRIDLVRQRYPQTFKKKFTLEELLLCIEAAVADINLYPPATSFWFRFSSIREEDVNFNPLSQTLYGGIPWTWVDLVTKGALLNALVSQGILEVDINFEVSDGGVTIRYNNAEGIKGWWTALSEGYEKQKKLIKIWEFRPQAVGTLPFTAGLPHIISSLLGPISSAGWPWFKYYAGRPG